MKRLFDFIVALIALILLSPLLVIVGALVRYDSSGPALFRQQRVGLDGKLFSLCKFRSMVVPSGDDTPYNTQQNDPRITRVGKFIRATSIDELPQLINIVKGEMSIVGPRPDLALMEKDYAPEDWRLRISVRPGITGLAQINGRSNISYTDRLYYDLSYAKKHGFVLDMKIIMKTFGMVLQTRNAN